METLLENVFSIELDMYAESLSVPVLVAEAPGTDKETRSRLTQILFETFKVSGVCFANSAVLSLFASGRTRGVVLECGSGLSSVVPVFEGYSLPHALLRLDAAGQDVTEYLKKNIKVRPKHTHADGVHRWPGSWKERAARAGCEKARRNGWRERAARTRG